MQREVAQEKFELGEGDRLGEIIELSDGGFDIEE